MWQQIGAAAGAAIGQKLFGGKSKGENEYDKIIRRKQAEQPLSYLLEDAKRHQIHPLYAIGQQQVPYQAVVGQQDSGDIRTEALSAVGGAIGGHIAGKSARAQQKIAFQNAQSESVSRQEANFAQAQYYRSLAAKATQAATSALDGPQVAETFPTSVPSKDRQLILTDTDTTKPAKYNVPLIGEVNAPGGTDAQAIETKEGEVPSFLYSVLKLLATPGAQDYAISAREKVKRFKEIWQKHRRPNLFPW